MPSFRPRTLGEYFQMIWRRRLLLLLVVAVTLSAIFLVIRGIPDLYQSSASVVVAGNLEDRQAIAARVATLTERLNSRAFLEPLVVRHNLYAGEPTSGAMEVAIAKMRKDIKVEPKYRNDIPEALTITYRNPDPAVARAVASDLVSTFAQMNEALERQMVDRAAQIDGEVAQIEDRLKQLGEQKFQLAARSRVAAGMRGALSAARAQRIAAESSIETLSDKQYALEKQIAEQKRQISEQEKIAKTAVGDLKSGGSYGVLLVRKAELEGQVKEYTTQYTEKNPKVVQARTQLAEINQQIAQFTANQAQQGAPLNSPEARELRAMQREQSRLETELEITKRELARKQQLAGPSSAPVTGSLIKVSEPVAGSDAPIDVGTETDRERLRDRYNTLLRQRDELALHRTASAGLDPGLFQIVDTPVEPTFPSAPDRMKLRLIGLALALIAGLVVVAAVEAPRLFSIRDERDVRYYLGAPVVALIPDTLTPTERGRVRKMLMARMMLVLILALLLVPALMLVLNELRVFQLLAYRW